MARIQVKEENVPKLVKEVLKDLPEECKPFGWDCHGSYVLFHKTLERVAALKKVTFDMPQIVQSDAENRICVLIVKGHLNERSEWAVGEAMPCNIDKGNNKQTFPYSMAEKRAKDKVILKLVGLHGDAYSSDEADWKTIKEQKDAELANKNKNGTKETKSKLDEQFGEGSKQEVMQKNEVVKKVFELWPNAKITSIEPSNEGFKAYAEDTVNALRKAETVDEVLVIGDEIQASIDLYYNKGKGVKKMFDSIYNDCYAPALEKFSAEVNFALPNADNAPL